MREKRRPQGVYDEANEKTTKFRHNPPRDPLVLKGVGTGDGRRGVLHEKENLEEPGYTWNGVEKRETFFFEKKTKVPLKGKGTQVRGEEMNYRKSFIDYLW